MPLPRFSKLDAAAQAQLLDAALNEFAARGFAQASIASICEAGGISRGRLYYYFADKEDLFVAVLERSFSHAFEDYETFDYEALSAETYWPVLRQRALENARNCVTRPEEVQLWRTFQESFRGGPQQSERVELLLRRWKAPIRRVLDRGRTLGVIREDLDPELLSKLVDAVDVVLDSWGLAQFDTDADLQTPEMRARVASHVETILDLHQRIMAPVVVYPPTPKAQ